MFHALARKCQYLLETRVRGASDAFARQPACVSAGRRIYAIGDIHGRDDLFADLIDRIAGDDAERGPALTTIIALGDLIDRGPNSCQVIERALLLKRQHADFRVIMGNHEQILLEALQGDRASLRCLTRMGGDATLESYGLNIDQYNKMTFDELQRLLPSLVPLSHFDFLNGSKANIIIDDYMFVHAGVRPGVALEAQADNDLRWIRGEFIASQRYHGKVIVHGHNASTVPENLPNRIGVDTCGYATGVLTAVGLEGHSRWFLSTT